MSWSLKGTYFENCNCDSICPCITSGMSAAADNDRCNVVLVFHVDSGDVEGLDVSGLSVVMMADTPPVMSDGGWRVGLFLDAAASPQQAEALGAVFGGQKGGMPAALAPMIGEMLGIESAPIDYADDGNQHRVKVGDAIELEVEDFVSGFSATGDPVRFSGVGFPNDTLTVARPTTSRMNAFGMEWSYVGKHASSSPFTWAAA